MKAFITGVSGFVGAALARHLLQNGCKVHGVARPTSQLWRLESIKKDIDLHIGDLRDEDFVRSTLQKVKPDVVHHLAVHGAYPMQKDTEAILSTTMLSTLNLLNASKEAGVGVFVNAGSSSEYGTKDHPMREDERLDPNSYYAVGKAAQTLLCRQFARQERFPVVTLRLFSVYGPFEEPGRLVPNVILRALRDEEISLADPRIARDFIYSEDVAAALFHASQRPELSGEVINLGTGVQHTIRELADAVVALTGSRSTIAEGAYEQRSFDTNTWLADTAKRDSLLEFVPRYTFENGLKESINWFSDHADLYKA